MKFEKRYPNHPSEQDILFDGDTLFRCETWHICAKCGDKTQFVSINFEAGTCSEECNTQLWKDYVKALAVTHPPDIGQ